MVGVEQIVLYSSANQSLFGIEHRQERQTSLCRYRPVGLQSWW